jgi:ABC-type amino acid transport system permease subunit
MMSILYFALTSVKAYSLPQPTADQGTITTILSIVFGIIGALALLVITIAGFRYILSAGDPQKTADAKSTIIYALIGLVVAISAEAIVAFVVNRL